MKNNSDKIQSFLASLHYLAKEAEREDLSNISDIIKYSINSIQIWVDGDKTMNKCDLLDTSIYYAIEFLSKFSLLTREKQSALVDLFDSIDERERLALCSSTQKEFQ